MALKPAADCACEAEPSEADVSMFLPLPASPPESFVMTLRSWSGAPAAEASCGSWVDGRLTWMIGVAARVESAEKSIPSCGVLLLGGDLGGMGVELVLLTRYGPPPPFTPSSPFPLPLTEEAGETLGLRMG